MATRQYNKQTFSAFVPELNDVLYFHCWTTNTRNGFCHSCWCDWLEGTSVSATTKISYYNRTWERFDYESVLKRAIEKFPKSMREDLNLMVERKARGEHERAEEQIRRFKELHDGLTDRQKELLAQTPPMQTQEDSDRMMGIMGIMNIFNHLGA